MPRISVTEGEKAPQAYKVKLKREVIKIGRAADNDVILKDESISTYHCEIIRVEGGYILKDNDSTNAVRFEGKRYSIIDLSDDTTFTAGDVEIHFELSVEECEELDEEDEFVSQEKIAPPKKKKKSSKDDDKKKGKVVDEDEDDEEEEEDEEEKEDKKKKDKVKSPPKVKVSSPIISLSLILFCILGFVVALSVKHYMKYGTFLVNDIINKKELPADNQRK